MVVMLVMLAVVMMFGGGRGQRSGSKQTKGDDSKKAVPDFHARWK